LRTQGEIAALHLGGSPLSEFRRNRNEVHFPQATLIRFATYEPGCSAPHGPRRYPKLLAIDHDPSNLEQINAALCDSGLEIIQASDADAGMELLKQSARESCCSI